MVKLIKTIAFVTALFVLVGCINDDNKDTSGATVSKECAFVNWISRDGNICFILANSNPRSYEGIAYFVDNKIVKLHEFSKPRWRTEKDIFFNSKGIVSRIETATDVCYYKYKQGKVSKIECKNQYTIVDYSDTTKDVATCKIYSNDGNFIKKEYCFSEPDIMPVALYDEKIMSSRVDY